MVKKIIPVFVFFLVAALSSQAQMMKKTQEYDEDKHAFHVHEHVMVTMKDGREVHAVIHGHVSRTKYYVREYKSRRQGKVHKKFIRPLNESEQAELDAALEAKKKK